MGIQEIKDNIAAARSGWEDEKTALAAARLAAEDTLLALVALGKANMTASAATRLAYSHKGSMEKGGQFALALADQIRVRISNQATALKAVIAELDKITPSIASEIDTLDKMYGILES